MKTSKLTKVEILFINLFASISCMIYELVLAQILSATLGNTMLRYGTTIGLYLASMGLGSYLSQQKNEQSLLAKLINIEISLSWIGLISPFLVIYLDRFSVSDIHYFSNLNYFMSYFLVIVVGLLTGMELPVLMSLSEDNQLNSSLLVLAVDYLGTLIGSLAFPLYLLPQLGVIYTSFLASLMNIIVSIYIIAKTKKINFLNLILTSTIVILIIVLFLNFDNYEHWLIQEVYLK